MLWGLYQTPPVVASFLGAWGYSQIINYVALEPIIRYVKLVLLVVVWPSVLPFLAWIPRVGTLLLSSTVDENDTANSGGSLSGRLETLTLQRSLGYAVGMTPEASCVAYGSNDAVAKAIYRGTVFPDDARTRANMRKLALTSTVARMTERMRHELIIKRYLVHQLKDAQRKRHRRMELATELQTHGGAPGQHWESAPLPSAVGLGLNYSTHPGVRFMVKQAVATGVSSRGRTHAAGRRRRRPQRGGSGARASWDCCLQRPHAPRYTL